MSDRVLDSQYRCPRCGKRMVLQPATGSPGENHNVHECWNCDFIYREKASA